MRELNSCYWSAAALAVCFEGHLAGLNTTKTGNYLSQPKFEFTSLTKEECFQKKEQLVPALSFIQLGAMERKEGKTGRKTIRDRPFIGLVGTAINPD